MKNILQKKVIFASLFALVFHVLPLSAPTAQAGFLEQLEGGAITTFLQSGTFPIISTASSEEEKQTVETVPEAEPKLTVQEVLLDVCKSNGYGEDCAKTLLGMLWTESSNRYNVVGDSGRALGYYQIHYRMHGVSVECATDLVCSSQWTIDYLESNHYPNYANYAVQCHNGCNAWNGYTKKVARYGEYFWNRPLEVNQDQEIRLPSKAIQIALVI